MLQMDEGSYKLTVINEDPSTTKAFQFKVKQIISSEAAKKQAMMMPSSQGQMPSKSANRHAQHQRLKQLISMVIRIPTFLMYLSPILVGFFVFFFVFLISGIALLRERTTGTLDRLLATPIKRHQIVFGYLIGYGLFAIVQTIIVVFYSVKVLDIVSGRFDLECCINQPAFSSCCPITGDSAFSLCEFGISNDAIYSCRDHSANLFCWDPSQSTTWITGCRPLPSLFRCTMAVMPWLGSCIKEQD